MDTARDTRDCRRIDPGQATLRGAARKECDCPSGGRAQQRMRGAVCASERVDRSLNAADCLIANGLTLMNGAALPSFPDSDSINIGIDLAW